jgi:putative ABC transport system ATP-binding protein
MTTEPTQPSLTARELSRTFILGSEEIHALHDVDMQVSPGELLVITGRSGSGKTTLLNLLAGLDIATSGVVAVDGQDLAKLSEWGLAQLRRHKIGFVFQSFGLLPLLSAFENVELPLRIAEWGRRDRNNRANEVLDMVGLHDRAGHRPYEMSGGEQQRVAVARAVAHRPSIILADEPTGELDSTTGSAIFRLLKDIGDREQVAVCVASHDVVVASKFATQMRQLDDGTFVT